MLPVYRPDPTSMPTQKNTVAKTAMKRIVSMSLTTLSHYDSTVRCPDYLGISTGGEIVLCPCG
jgi:hypothetical protein